MAQTQLYTKRAAVQVKLETSQDTYKVPAGDNSDWFLAQDVTYSVESTNWTPQLLRGDFLMSDEVPGSASATLTFSVPIHGGGAAGTPPEFSTALQGCGLDYTNSAGVSDTYTPVSVFDGAGGNPGASYSATVIIDGLRLAICGGYGNLTFSANPDQPAILTFTFQGQYVPVADDALEAPTYDTTIPPAYRSAALAFNVGGGWGERGVESVSFDLGNQLTNVADVQDGQGVDSVRITGRQTTGSVSMDARLVAAYDPWSEWRSGTAGSFTTGGIGAIAGNICTITMNRIVLRPSTVSDRNGIQAIEVPFSVCSLMTDVEGTNADLQIVFT